VICLDECGEVTASIGGFDHPCARFVDLPAGQEPYKLLTLLARRLGPRIVDVSRLDGLNAVVMAVANPEAVVYSTDRLVHGGVPGDVADRVKHVTWPLEDATLRDAGLVCVHDLDCAAELVRRMRDLPGSRVVVFDNVRFTQRNAAILVDAVAEAGGRARVLDVERFGHHTGTAALVFGDIVVE
jgi:hypothetical protein